MHAEIVYSRPAPCGGLDAVLAGLVAGAIAAIAPSTICREDARLRAVFGKLDVVHARALYARLVTPCDPLADAFATLPARRRVHLLQFLRDSRRGPMARDR
jgi:hypothetical protein